MKFILLFFLSFSLFAQINQPYTTNPSDITGAFIDQKERQIKQELSNFYIGKKERINQIISVPTDEKGRSNYTALVELSDTRYPFQLMHKIYFPGAIATQDGPYIKILESLFPGERIPTLFLPVVFDIPIQANTSLQSYNSLITSITASTLFINISNLSSINWKDWDRANFGEIVNRCAKNVNCSIIDPAPRLQEEFVDKIIGRKVQIESIARENAQGSSRSSFDDRKKVIKLSNYITEYSTGDDIVKIDPFDVYGSKSMISTDEQFPFRVQGFYNNTNWCGSTKEFRQQSDLVGSSFVEAKLVGNEMNAQSYKMCFNWLKEKENLFNQNPEAAYNNFINTQYYKTLEESFRVQGLSGTLPPLNIEQAKFSNNCGAISLNFKVYQDLLDDGLINTQQISDKALMAFLTIGKSVTDLPVGWGGLNKIGLFFKIDGLNEEYKKYLQFTKVVNTKGGKAESLMSKGAYEELIKSAREHALFLKAGNKVSYDDKNNLVIDLDLSKFPYPTRFVNSPYSLPRRSSMFVKSRNGDLIRKCESDPEKRFSIDNQLSSTNKKGYDAKTLSQVLGYMRELRDVYSPYQYRDTAFQLVYSHFFSNTSSTGISDVYKSN
jgi:hypothetical protein